MTRIIDGYAQPDIVAERGEERIMVFVETPSSLKGNSKALGKTLEFLRETEPNTRVDLVHTVPKGGKG